MERDLGEENAGNSLMTNEHVCRYLELLPDGDYFCGGCQKTYRLAPVEPTCKCVEVDAGGCVGFDVKDCPRHNPSSPTYVGRDHANRGGNP